MKAYHYTECGLDNIYLVNGVKITKTKSGDEEIFIHDIHGLHKAIGMILVSKRGFLSGKEIKFIRSTLDLSQTTLAKILGCSNVPEARNKFMSSAVVTPKGLLYADDSINNPKFFWEDICKNDMTIWKISKEMKILFK